MSGEKKEICFHIMHSMKGGCGKSTCSLFQALKLAKENLEGPAEVLLLDADFRGSAWLPLLFRDDIVARSETCADVLESLEKCSGAASPGSGSKHTIAIPDRYREEDNLSCFVQDMDFPPEELVQSTFSYAKEPDPAAESGVTYTMNGYLDFILAGAKSKDKMWFPHQNQAGKLAAGIYIHRLGRLLDFILYRNATYAPDNDRKKRPLGQYRNVVIDMPPGYDEYSDMILSLLRKLAVKDSRIKLHYYQVTTEDIGHMALALENIREMNERKTEFQEFETVNAILNNPFFPDSEDSAEYEERVKQNVSELYKALGAQETSGKVYRNEYNGSYHEYSTITERQRFETEDDHTLEIQENPWKK